VIKHVDVEHVAGAVKEGNCVIKAPLYDLAALFSDSEVKERIAETNRRKRIAEIRGYREMITEFKRIAKEQS
jgi:hypothetical protein